MPSTSKLCVWVTRPQLLRLEELGVSRGTTPAGYVRLLIVEATKGGATIPDGANVELLGVNCKKL